MRTIVWLSLVCVFVQVAVAQDEIPVFLNNELVSRNTPQRNTVPAEWPKNNCQADGRCFAVLQFDRILEEGEKAELQAKGIFLHHYLPRYAYLASYVGSSNLRLPENVRQLIPLLPHHKRPKGPLSGAGTAASYELVGIPFPGTSLVELAGNLQARGATVKQIADLTWLQAKTLELAA